MQYRLILKVIQSRSGSLFFSLISITTDDSRLIRLLSL